MLKLGRYWPWKTPLSHHKFNYFAASNDHINVIKHHEHMCFLVVDTLHFTKWQNFLRRKVKEYVYELMYITKECANLKTRQLYCCFKTIKRRVTHISSFLMRIFVLLIFIILFTFFDLIWWFIIMRYFHIQTSAIQRKYPTLTVRIFLFQRAHIPSIEIHSYSNIFRSQAKCPEVSMA